MTYELIQGLALDSLWSLSSICERVTEDQLRLPTPCTDWSLEALLEHLTGQQRGFTAALHGAGKDLAEWRPRVVGEGRSDLFASVRDLRLALLTELADSIWVPELRPDSPVPLTTALSALLVDTVTHAWDVAASLGITAEFSAPVLRRAYAVATKIPDGPERDRPGSSFAHALPGGDQPTLAGYLALLGRDASWSRTS